MDVSTYEQAWHVISFLMPLRSVLYTEYHNKISKSEASLGKTRSKVVRVQALRLGPESLIGWHVRFPQSPYIATTV